MGNPQSGDPLAFFSPGQQFAPTAETLNAWQDAARLARGVPGTSGGRGPMWPRAGVLIKNTAEGDCARGAVLELSAPVFKPSDFSHVIYEEPYLLGVAPTADYATCAILNEPIQQGKTGRGILCGLCWGKVAFETQGDRYAYAVEGQTDALTSSAVCGSAYILWPTDGSDTTDALLLTGLVPHAIFTGTLAEAWTGGEATVQITGSDATVTATAAGVYPDMDAGDQVICFFGQDKAFHFFALPKDTQDIQTSVSLTESGLQFKKRHIRAFFTDDEESDGDLIPTSACPT